MMDPAKNAQLLRERGHVLVERALGPEDLAPVIADLEASVDEVATRLHQEGLLPSAFADHGFETRLARISEHTDAGLKTFFNQRYLPEGLFRLLRSPRILDLAEAVLGPEITCHAGYRVRPKMRATPRTAWMAEMPWHQDGAYLDPECDAHTYLTVWLPLVEVTPENGCLEVILGGGRPILPHRNLHGRSFLHVRPEARPTDPVIALPARPGDIILMNGRTPHRSGPNRTDGVRWAIDMRYHRPDSPHGHAGEAGFLARSLRNPGAVVEDRDAYLQARGRDLRVEAARYRRWPTENAE
jgi:ectoine hydroxylase-related dioxygenase (phytanoyl-CoA dioxygenase family)